MWNDELWIYEKLRLTPKFWNEYQVNWNKSFEIDKQVTIGTKNKDCEKGIFEINQK